MVIQSNKISPDFNGTEAIKKLGVSVQNAKDGSVSNVFLDQTKDCAVQKDSGSIVYTKAQAKQLHKEDMEFLDDGSISPAAFINSCMTGEDMQALSEEETPLEEYTSSQLERAVSRVKKQRSEKEQAVEKQVEKVQDERDARERHLMKKLPDTPENVARLSNAVNMLTELDTFSAASMKFFIARGERITPEGIGGSRITTGIQDSVPATQPEEDFSQIEKQAEDILQEGGLPVTEETMGIAKWLYENDLPVTAENVLTYQQIEQLKNESTDTLIARIVDGMVDGVKPEKADLTKLSTAEAKEVIDAFLATEEEVFHREYPTEADFLRAKRQMEEIRLTMTIEAARTMSAKGITLDISYLEEIVEELKLQEQQAKEALLAETGTPIEEKNLTVMTDTVQAAQNVLFAPVELLGQTRQAGYVQTLTELSDSAVTLTEQYQKAEQSYEAVGTEVRRDLGDSMTKAFQNVDDILKELDLEITGRNQRAVRILAYNQMPLDKESILQMKEYDSRVTTLMESLKPAVVSEMIKKEINPLEMSLEELSEAVKEVQTEANTDDISFRKFLWKMDHQGGLSEEERKSMIGIYRLLDKVEKSDGAAIGKVIKEGRELSFSSLLSAVRTKKAEGMEFRVDDDFGGLEEVITTKESISDQIQAAYDTTLTTGLVKNLSPKVMSELLHDKGDMSLEAFLEACEAENETGMAEYYNHLADEVKAIMADAGERLQEFLQQLDLPDTLNNLAMAQAYMNSGAKEYESLWKKEESEELQEIFDEPEKLDEFYQSMDENHAESLEKSREGDDITYDGVVSLAKMANSISFYQNLRSHQVYEVPIVTERGITTCNVTIEGGKSREKGTVEIYMESESLGSVQATFKLSGKHVKGFMTAENADSLKECRSILDNFEKDLEESGFTMDSESLIQGSRRSLHVGNKSEGAKNQDLYRIAKMFIVNIT
ncbi:MAG: hypothetical protein J1F22_01100 [Lachnospiraceae bacterium]|nr:hypothetical protein [Lachnospiraceae bacterium]